MRFLKEIIELFFPPVCPLCGKLIKGSDALFCTQCLYDVPLTHFSDKPDNPVFELISNYIPVRQASSFIYFSKDAKIRKAIHHSKYYGRWHYGETMGRWFGRELEKGGLYGDVDIVVPLPLHFMRRVMRGYNQSYYISRGIAKEICRPLATLGVIRHKYNTPQVRKRFDERWDNVDKIFKVTKPELFSGKHVLLVDDVLTTGATLISCVDEIMRSVPDCKVSVVTLSVVMSTIHTKRY